MLLSECILSSIGEDMNFQKFTADDLRLLLSFLPLLNGEMEDAKLLLRQKIGTLLSSGHQDISWCGLYEQPLMEHLSAFIAENGFQASLLHIAESPNQVVAMAESFERMDDEIEAKHAAMTLEERGETEKNIIKFFGVMMSLYNSLRCVLVFGCHLNDLIVNVRAGDDRSLFNALRLDGTIIGCPSVMNRISLACMLDDKLFMRRLKSALNSRLQKREQANFQKIRLILCVLSEVNAERLTNEQLYTLFVEQLDLYSRDSRKGDVMKNLRKFADQYMATPATT